MSGFIRDNGLASPLNRGSFYACHNERNDLTGVALIGHTILFEALDEGAVQSFAALARKNSSNHLLMGEHDAVRQFWNNYAVDGESPRLVHPILFLQRHDPFEIDHPVEGLRLATRDDLEQVVLAQAAMAFETSGVDPLAKDPAGFCERYLRRIEKDRVWVLMKEGQLIFKTDVTSESADVAYLEGVYVSPEERGKGLGRSCLQAIGNILFERKKAIYLFVEQENTRLQSFYFNLGFSLGGHYDLLYF
jgi:predicted GNAT family acetyltransferase